MKLLKGKKVFFASDNHLGAPNFEKSRKREKIFINWLEHIRKEAAAIFLLGDLFDFWFEYKKVVPKGFVRVLGKLAEITDSGIPIYFFVGNHDLWMRDYFEKELNIKVFFRPKEFEINGKTFFLAHGDGLGTNDIGYKRMKKVFTNPVLNYFFRWLHPDIGVSIAQYFSLKNKLISGKEQKTFLGREKEFLIQYCEKKLKERNRDFFIFGHRHLPLSIDLNEKAKYINLGDWINYYTYAEFDGKETKLKEWKKT